MADFRSWMRRFGAFVNIAFALSLVGYAQTPAGIVPIPVSATTAPTFTLDTIGTVGNQLGQYYTPPSDATVANGVQFADVLEQQDFMWEVKYVVGPYNQKQYSGYQVALNVWNGTYGTVPDVTKLPAPPSYEGVDAAKFDSALRAWSRDSALNGASEFSDTSFIVAYPAKPAPTIAPAGSTLPVVTGPIGATVGNNPGVFQSSAADSATAYPSGSVYVDRATGSVYQKYITPFNTFWIQLH